MWRTRGKGGLQVCMLVEALQAIFSSQSLGLHDDEMTSAPFCLLLLFFHIMSACLSLSLSV